MKLMKAPRQVSSHAQTIKFADGTNVCTSVVPVLDNVYVPHSTMPGTRTSNTSAINITAKQTYGEVVHRNLHVVMDASR